MHSHQSLALYQPSKREIFHLSLSFFPLEDKTLDIGRWTLEGSNLLRLRSPLFRQVVFEPVFDRMRRHIFSNLAFDLFLRRANRRSDEVV